MGHSRIEIINDPLEGEILVAEGERRKGGAYVARIIGLDTKYKYARQFVSEREWLHGYHGIVRAKVPIKDLRSPWDLLEIRAGGSWKNDYRKFYLWDAQKKEITPLKEEELRQRLAEILAEAPM